MFNLNQSQSESSFIQSGGQVNLNKVKLVQIIISTLKHISFFEIIRSSIGSLASLI